MGAEGAAFYARESDTAWKAGLDTKDRFFMENFPGTYLLSRLVIIAFRVP